MMKEMFLGIARHLLTAGGGALATQGVVDAAQANTVVGALMTLLGIAWSVYEKKKRI